MLHRAVNCLALRLLLMLPQGSPFVLFLAKTLPMVTWFRTFSKERNISFCRLIRVQNQTLGFSS